MTKFTNYIDVVLIDVLFQFMQVYNSHLFICGITTAGVVIDFTWYGVNADILFTTLSVE